jgi:glycosyltransferase involved in cell wall biosynthesis
VLYVSRLTPEKNPQVLVEAVNDHLPDRELQVLVVGTGEASFRASLRKQADDRFRFLSNLPFESLKAAYNASTVFTLLGTWEGLPTVILEAMATGLPVVATNAGAIPDAVEHGENGRLVSTPPDSGAVAAAIEYYVNRPDERATIAERNRERIDERYHWDDIAESILDIYKAVADE